MTSKIEQSLIDLELHDVSLNSIVILYKKQEVIFDLRKYDSLKKEYYSQQFNLIGVSEFEIHNSYLLHEQEITNFELKEVDGAYILELLLIINEVGIPEYEMKFKFMDLVIG